MSWTVVYPTLCRALLFALSTSGSHLVFLASGPLTHIYLEWKNAKSATAMTVATLLTGPSGVVFCG